MSALCQTRKYSGYSRRLENELKDLANVCASARACDNVGNLSHIGLAAPNLAELVVAKRNQDSKKEPP